MCFRVLEPRRAGQIGQVDGQEQSEEPEHGCGNQEAQDTVFERLRQIACRVTL